MGKVKQIVIKIELVIFTTTWSISKISTKSIAEGLISITLDTPQFKKIDDGENIYSANALWLLVNHANGYVLKKKMEIITWFLMILMMKIKRY